MDWMEPSFFINAVCSRPRSFFTRTTLSFSTSGTANEQGSCVFRLLANWARWTLAGALGHSGAAVAKPSATAVVRLLKGEEVGRLAV